MQLLNKCALFGVRSCLVHSENQKVFKIFVTSNLVAHA